MKKVFAIAAIGLFATSSVAWADCAGHVADAGQSKPSSITLQTPDTAADKQTASTDSKKTTKPGS